MSDETTLPTKEELLELPHEFIIVYAVRNALRVFPLLAIKKYPGYNTHLSACIASIGWAALFSVTGRDDDKKELMRKAVEKAGNVARATYEAPVYIDARTVAAADAEEANGAAARSAYAKETDSTATVAVAAKAAEESARASIEAVRFVFKEDDSPDLCTQCSRDDYTTLRNKFSFTDYSSLIKLHGKFPYDFSNLKDVYKEPLFNSEMARLIDEFDESGNGWIHDVYKKIIDGDIGGDLESILKEHDFEYAVRFINIGEIPAVEDSPTDDDVLDFDS